MSKNKTESKWRDRIESFVISILDAENQTEQNQAVEEFELVISRIEQETREEEKTKRLLRDIEIKEKLSEISEEYKINFENNPMIRDTVFGIMHRVETFINQLK